MRMKLLVKQSIYICLAGLLLWSCKKDETKAVLKQGTLTGFTATSTTLVLDSTQASSNGITFSWQPADYGAGVAVSYTFQIDSINGDFTKPVSVAMNSTLSKSYTVADFNQLVQSLGLAPEEAGQVHARVKSDIVFANSSASSVASVFSDVLAVTVTPYSTKPKPKYPVPDSLYIVGDATPGGWGNPVPIPAQRFSQIDETTFGIILQLTGGKQYVFLPKNGDWGHKYNVPSNSDPALKDGGDFQPDAGNANIPGPDADGLYKIIVDFIKGTYTVTAVAAGTIPDDLFIVGDATAGGWGNPVPVPAQQFTKTSAYTFSLTLPLTGGKQYVFLPTNGDWTHKYNVTDDSDPALKEGGTFKEDAGSKNIPGPDASGNYRIDVDFVSYKYKVTQL